MSGKGARERRRNRRGANPGGTKWAYLGNPTRYTKLQWMWLETEAISKQTGLNRLRAMAKFEEEGYELWELRYANEPNNSNVLQGMFEWLQTKEINLKKNNHEQR